MLARRQLLTASAALPAVLVTGCRSLDAALGKTPPLSADVRSLQAAIATEQGLIDLYARTRSRYSALGPLLDPLLAEHREHLARLDATISYPQGYQVSPSHIRHVMIPADRGAAVRALTAAETSAAAAQTGRLNGVSPSIAQLFASIAACEAIHAAVLQGAS